MTQPSWVPEGIDLETPSVSRMYDYYLGGFHNFAPDRALADRVIAAAPNVPAVAVANRAFLRRAVTHLVELGIRQFLDVGSGIPTVGNVHEIAQGLAPEARVVYVDLDPIAVAHSNAILAGNPNAGMVMGDLRRPEEVLADPVVTRLLDFEQPTAVLMVAVLHFIQDTDLAMRSVKAFRTAAGSGGYLVLSHIADDVGPGDVADRVKTLYRQTTAAVATRTHAEVTAMFEGCTLLPPGVVLADEWQPGTAAPIEDPQRSPVWSGIGRVE